MSAAEPPTDPTTRHRSTLDVYEQRTQDWVEQRRPPEGSGPVDLAARVRTAGVRGPIADLGCGPGWFTPLLGTSAVAIDAARAMVARVHEHAPDALLVQADLAGLPLRSGVLAGAYAGKSWIHLVRSDVPLALADTHRAMQVGAQLEAVVFGGDAEHAPLPGDTFAGRWFSMWPSEMLHAVLEGAGFTDIDIEERGRDRAMDLVVRATRARTLADTVSAGMRLLVVGLNPSLHAADAGVGFATRSNHFWPAALHAGLVTKDRDPRHALLSHGIGMTDLVKRATARADELASHDYRSGYQRLEQLVAWLAPRAVCFVGLAGWRVAVDKHAVEGVQPATVAGRPVYVMGSTSGLNARSSVATGAEHLRSAAALATRAS